MVQGSLGGLQVLDLSPEGQTHQRILSLGKDPLAQRNVDIVSCLDAELYSMCRQPILSTEEYQAFSFSVRRPLEGIEPGEYPVHVIECSSVELPVPLVKGSVCVIVLASVQSTFQNWKSL